ncbi:MULTISPECIES: AAA family ATPase [unclassified Corallococcus]|uniref:AAA family ATPase n=1 Tax=unclassified Corallococcus TaxID=2685029 RepID=UPI001A8C7864|nr:MULTISPECIES: AAA family ATPase [unclassified Corallococcus]MBN9681670.1 AAA family ATPase [Corallococcus sp. NCSPR001]WAS86758.1 AAA family ATPase [Corallococcus sp. NCRR]
MPTLERIEIAGFKSIKEMALDLRPINVLIGANGAGKSNFISVFTLLQRMREGKLQQHVAQAGGADSLLHYGRKRTPLLRLKFTFSEQKTSHQFDLAPSDDDSLIITNETIALPSDSAPPPFPLATDQRPMREAGWALSHESVLRDAFIWLEKSARPMMKPLVKDIKQSFAQLGSLFGGLKVYHFHDTSSSARLKQTQNIDDNEALRADASNLAAFLYLLREKHSDSYRRIVATVRLAAPYFDDFRLRPSPLNEQKILLEWSERESDDYFNAHALSDGTLRFICLATLLLQPELPPMIIIDEPELGLHPYAIQLLAGMVRSASQKSQIILSTQSVTLVNQFTPEDLVIVDRQDRASTFHRPTAEKTASWLESYSLGELWEKNVLGGRPG